MSSPDNSARNDVNDVNDAFMQAMHFRHACKLFDDTKKIPKEELEYILECGRLSPSSFGLEQWRFLLVKDAKLRERIREVAWDQPQITTCSELIVYKSLKKDLIPYSDYVKKMVERKGVDAEKMEAYLDKFSGFMEGRLDDASLSCWSSKQIYIAAANMMSGAAFRKIDSCAIEGYEKSALEDILEIDKERFEVPLMVCFGYRAKEQQQRFRLQMQELVEEV